MKPTVNECRALARQACHSCWGTDSSTCHNPDTYCRHLPVRQNRNSRGRSRTHTAAAPDSRSAVAGSMPVQGNKAADSSRLVEAHSRPVVRQVRRPRPVPNRPSPNRLPASPSHRRPASLHHPSRPRHASLHHPQPPLPPPCHAAWAPERDSAMAKATAADRQRRSGFGAITVCTPGNYTTELRSGWRALP